MGLDFIRNAAPSFKKGIDRSRIALATPSFFTQQPVVGARFYSALLHPGESANVGEKFGVRMCDQRISLYRGLTQFAVLENPPASLVQAISDSFGEAYGTVEELLDEAELIEVSIC